MYNPEAERARAKLWYRNNADKARESKWIQFGIINPDGSRFRTCDYERILETQNGHCVFCAKGGRLDVDHDHVTGIVRGLLCRNHNVALGKFGDSTLGITKVLEYSGGR